MRRRDPQGGRGTRGPRRVVLLGASSGIGRATAHALAARGDALVLASRSAETLAEVAQECRARAPREHADPQPDPLVVPTDITVREDVDALLRTAREHLGRIDAVVSTPAVIAYGRFEEIPADVFDRVITVNLLGTANVARAAIQQFRADGGGHLVLIGSLLGTTAVPWLAPYVTSRWAVHGLAHCLRLEARTLPGVDVSIVSPGGVDTPVYLQAANYAGRVGRPPPPVDRPETVARGILRVLDRPRRTLSVGWANGLWTAFFRSMPRAYDAVALRIGEHAALSRETVAPTTGNVVAAVPEQEAVHGRWGRQWLRGVGVGAAVLAAWRITTAARHRGRTPGG